MDLAHRLFALISIFVQSSPCIFYSRQRNCLVTCWKHSLLLTDVFRGQSRRLFCSRLVKLVLKVRSVYFHYRCRGASALHWRANYGLVVAAIDICCHLDWGTVVEQTILLKLHLFFIGKIFRPIALLHAALEIVVWRRVCGYEGFFRLLLWTELLLKLHCYLRDFTAMSNLVRWSVLLYEHGRTTTSH